MGLFKKLKRAVKGVAKIAVKTAPIWTNFIPGGSAVSSIIQRVAPMVDKVKQMRGVGKALLTKGVTPQRMTTVAGGMGPALWRTAQAGAEESAAIAEYESVGHSGIRGPVPSHWGPKHRVMARSMPMRRARRRAAAPRGRRRSRRSMRGGRNRYGQFVSRRRRRAA